MVKLNGQNEEKDQVLEFPIAMDYGNQNFVMGMLLNLKNMSQLVEHMRSRGNDCYRLIFDAYQVVNGKKERCQVIFRGIEPLPISSVGSSSKEQKG